MISRACLHFRRAALLLSTIGVVFGAVTLLPTSVFAATVPVTLSPSALSFSATLINTTSTNKAVVLKNNQSSALTNISIVTSGDFAQTNNCGTSVVASGSCTINVNFTPTAAGVRTGVLTVTDSASNSPQTASLSGIGLDMSFNLSQYNFSITRINTTSAVQTATLTNHGSNTITITSVTTTGDFAATNNCGSLAPGASCPISITFTPTAGGQRYGTLTVTDSDVESPQTATLYGIGSTAILTTSASFSSQSVQTMSAPKQLTLTNYDSNPLMISSVTVSGDFLQTNNCGSTVAPGASCTFAVSFIPSATGTRSGKLTVYDSAVYLTSQTANLSGTGALPALMSLSVSPGNYSLQMGQSRSYSAIGSFSDGGTRSLPFAIWNSSNPSVATMSGNIATSVGSGAATISATSGAISGYSSLNNSLVGITPSVASITLTQTMQFQASVQNASDQNVFWAVDGVPGGNGTSGTISSSGLYTPPASAGTHTIYAAAETDQTQVGQASVTVTDYQGTLTYANDNLRTSQNLSETVLTPLNVNQNQFGKLFSYPVDGFINAQPLYVENVSIPGQGFHNVVYVATMNDSVYAFDADGLTATPLWQVSFINPQSGVTVQPGDNCYLGTTEGIVGTPVIDQDAGTIYLVASTLEPGTKTPVYKMRLHALDITTGAERTGSPVLIQASVPGTGEGTDGHGNLPFIASWMKARPGLLLSNGVVYVSFGAKSAEGPTVYYHHGWMLAYDAYSLQQVGALSTSPDSWGSSLWQSGAAPAADSNGSVYAMTGNGALDADIGGTDYGFSYIRVNLTGGLLSVVDFFAPFGSKTTELPDEDLGSGGPLLLPDQPGPYPHSGGGRWKR